MLGLTLVYTRSNTRKTGINEFDRLASEFENCPSRVSAAGATGSCIFISRSQLSAIFASSFYIELVHQTQFASAPAEWYEWLKNVISNNHMQINLLFKTGLINVFLPSKNIKITFCYIFHLLLEKIKLNYVYLIRFDVIT